MPPHRARPGRVVGTPADVIVRLEPLVEAGATHLSFGPPLGPDPLAAVRKPGGGQNLLRFAAFGNPEFGNYLPMRFKVKMLVARFQENEILSFKKVDQKILNKRKM